MDKTTTSPLTFPERGKDHQQILQELERMKADDIDWRAGRTWSLVYFVDDEHLELLKQAHSLYFSENTINPYAFPSMQRMEHELVRMTADLLHGGPQAVGTLTAGGTESISLAVYAYRERARRLFPHIKNPEIIVPASIHPAFFKAAHLMGLAVRRIPIGSDLRADVGALEAAITPNTILIAASAPCYPYGIIDPISEIGVVAERYRLPFHVDACVGGFMLPWVEELGNTLPVWDFRVPGVTSMSADLHKFAYGEKGASTILYRSMDYLRYQFYILPDWCGGIYASTSLIGTRSVGPIAAAWAAVNALGREGYLRIARRVMDATEHIRAELAAMPDIEVLGAPHMNMLAYRTRNNRPDLFVVADQLADRGWMVDRQQRPNSIHIGVMSHNADVLDEYLADLRDAVAYAKANPGATARGNAAMYGLMARIPFKGMVEENVRKVFENLYGPDLPPSAEPEQVPAWQGWLNRLLTTWSRWRRKG